MTEERITNRQLRALVYSAQSSIHGTGLFARRAFAAGEYIGTYGGPEARRNGIYVLWVYTNGDDRPPTGRSGRNLLRFLNHARPGNAEFDSFDLYALVDIQVDEEITFDYDWSSDELT